MAMLAGQEDSGNSFYQEAVKAEAELKEFKAKATPEQLATLQWVQDWFKKYYNAGLKHPAQILRDGSLRRPKTS
jgi:hypothetical protein